jgi:glycosyltransferase involved in cell wall biosynthesis
VHVVHNGLPPLDVDRDQGRRTIESLVGSSGGDIVSLVGRIDPTKGHRELLAVLRDLLTRRPRLHVAFIGAEHFPHLEFAEDLRRELAERALEDAVTFVGFREDAVELIAGSDVVVIPSTIEASGMGREGFPYVGLEAMAVGTPVVGYAHGGLPEMLGDCGLLVPPGDHSALRHAILDVLESEEERDRLARCGRKRMQERFSLAGMVEAMKARYREAADERS